MQLPLSVEFNTERPLGDRVYENPGHVRLHGNMQVLPEACWSQERLARTAAGPTSGGALRDHEACLELAINVPVVVPATC
jgi:hypothetical protein